MEGFQNMSASKSRHFIFLTILATILNIAEPEDCSVKLDLAFVIDGSGSICSDDPCTNWRFMLQFFHKIVEGLPIGPNDTRVALLTFSSTTTINWYFTRFTEKSSLLSAIDNLYYPSGGTALVPALQTLTSSIFPASSDRPGASKVAIIITDGQPNEPLAEVQQVAAGVHSRGIKILAVGVTSKIREDTLEILSSAPKEENVTYFKANDFSSVSSIQSQLQNRICQITNTTDAVITKQPLNVATQSGSEVQLNCGSNIIEFFPNWTLSRDGTYESAIVIASICKVNLEYEAYYSVNRSGLGVCNLIISNATLSQAGVYTCTDVGLAAFSANVLIIEAELESNVTDQSDVVNGDIIQFKYSVSYNGSVAPAPVIPMFVSWSSFGKIVDSHSEILANKMVYYINVKAQPPEVPQYEFKIVFGQPQNVTDYASNVPSFSYTSRSAIYHVLYGPEASNMNITGDNGDLIPYSNSMQCEVFANPFPTYTWIEEETNMFISGSTIQVLRSGIYNCTAKNAIRNKTYTSSKSIYIEVIKANISKGPQNMAALVGSDVKLECASIGSSTLLSWFLSNGPTDANQTVIAESCRVKPEFASRFYVIAGSNDSGVCNLLIRNVFFNDTGVYTCSELNQTSFSSIVSIVVVVQKANTSKGPLNVAALVGSEVKLECVSNGSNALPSWLLSKNPTDANKIVIADSCSVKPEYASQYFLITGSSGSGVCNLLIRNATLNDTGVYTCNDRNLIAFSSIVSILEVQKTVTKKEEVVSGDTIIFHYSVKLNETQHLPVTVHASSFSNQKRLRSIDRDIVTTVYSYEILTKPEGVPTFEFMINFSAPVNNPPNFASNAPSYCYQSISTGFMVSFKPEEKNMTIRGDTNGFVFDGGILHCHVSSYPPPVYTWQDQTSGNITNGETTRVTRSGKYTCNASNVIRNQIEWCSKSIEVQVVSTETIAFLEKRYAGLYWPLVLLAVIVFGFVTVLIIYLVHRHHQNSDSLFKGKKNCPSNIDQPNVEQQALNDCDLPNASPHVDSNQQKEPSGTMDMGSMDEVYSGVDKSAQKQRCDSAEEIDTSV